MESFEKSGVWWVPGFDQEKVPGKLTFSHEEGVTLEVVGRLAHFHQRDAQAGVSIVWGADSNGEYITLFNVDDIGSSFNSTGYSTQDYRALFIVRGGLFLDNRCLAVRKLQVEYTHLPEWVDPGPLEVRSGYDLFLDSTEVQVVYQVPDSPHFEVPGGSFWIADDFSVSDLSGMVTKIHRMPHVVFQSSEMLGLEEFLDRFVFPFKDFLTLATGRPNYLGRVFMTLEDRELAENRNFDPRHPGIVKIEVIFGQSNHPRTKSSKVYRREMALSYERLLDEAPQAVSNWFSFEKEYANICNLLLASEYNENLYLENRFLNIVFAAEAFHRDRYNNEVIPKAQARRRRRDIIASAPSRHKSWLRESFHFSNEPRFKARIRELVADLDTSTLRLIQDVDKFVMDIANTRNHLVHNSRTMSERALREDDLFVAAEMIAIMLRSLFFKEMGLEGRTRERAVRCSRLYRLVDNRSPWK